MKWLLLMANKSIKLIIISAFIILTVSVRANPIALVPPEFFVSELRFDSSGNWIIKIESTPFNISESVDSVRINTSSGSAKWTKFVLVDTNGYPIDQQVYTLQKDSLDSDLIINQEGDVVQVTTYYNELVWQGNDIVTHSLTFGNYQGATVRSPKERESIVHVPWLTDALVYYPTQQDYFCTSQSFHSNLYAIATANESGDKTVCSGTIRATIHNPTNQPFSESVIQIRDDRYYTFFNMYRQADGTYEGNVYACYYNLDKLHPSVWLCTYYEYRRHDYWTIDPVQFTMEKDSVVLLDIYINGYVGLSTVKTEEAGILKIYPNPVVGNSFNYETVLPVNSTNSAIDIAGLNGQRVGHYPIFENKGNITLPPNIPKGVYTVSLIVNQKNYAAAKITVP